MKILIIHNFHRTGSASGDDLVFNNESKLLADKGHYVYKYSVINDSYDKANFFKKIFLTFGMVWSFSNYHKIRKIIKSIHPDIVHIHTFFPLLSPSIFYAAKKEKCKVVVTLHDTRLVCPCATSFRNNCICNKCLDGHYFRMVKYGCYKNSKIQSFIAAFVFKTHRILKTFYRKIDAYICLNDTQINLLLKDNYPSGKIFKKPNFIYPLYDSTFNFDFGILPKKFVVFYGRLSEEKGIRCLMSIWNSLSNIPLVIMGGGPLSENVLSWSKNKRNIYYLGYLSHSICLEIVKKSSFAVFPSIWYEGCSMVEIEEESLAKPIVSFDIGFSSELIKNGANGFKVPLSNLSEFKEKINLLWNDSKLCNEMGINAKDDFEINFSPEGNYLKLIHIYSSVLNQHCK